MKKKVILVTGASSGIGYDVVKCLLERGYTVYAAARRVELMEPLKAQGAHLLQMDVTDEASMQAGVDALLGAEGQIDVLVNNAGYGYFGAVETVPMAEARRQLEVNVFGLARLCQMVLPTMRKQGSGRIVNLSSVAGRSVIYFGGWYHVSKYSVEALSDAMRMELKPFGIDVVKIEPGAIKTDWGIIAAKHLKESSAGTPYEEAGSRWADAMHWGYSSRYLSQPRVITRAILRAIEIRHPKTRYCTGRFARLMMFFHSVLPPRWWDAMMRMGANVKFS